MTAARWSTTAGASGELSAQSGELRRLSVMFCDLWASTALAERLDPEELLDLMQTYQRGCDEVIARYDVHMAQYWANDSGA